MRQTADAVGVLPPELSIIVPVLNGAKTLRASLEALQNAPGPAREIIVVDDGSDDGSAEIAASLGIYVIQHGTNLGCAVARNHGAKLTTAPIMVFADADVVVHPGALERISRFMAQNNDYSAVFGSYDAEPSDPGFVSQYRNLLHHFTHQAGNREATTFWTGLGAVRRSAFESIGGFWYPHLSDIAFGLDLSDSGYRIRLDHGLLCTHLKPWTLRTMVSTDALLRAAPWAVLILSRGRLTDDLNVRVINRIGVAFANAALAFAGMALFVPNFAVLAGLSFFASLIANIHVLEKFRKQRGVLFTVGAIPLHFVHQLCAGAGLALALKRCLLGRGARLRDELSMQRPHVEPHAAFRKQSGDALRASATPVHRAAVTENRARVPCRLAPS